MRFTSISSLLLPLLCASFASALSVSDRSNVEIPPPTARQIERRDSTVSVRTAKRGTFVGLSLSAVGQDQFSGIRYVQAPTASTRFQRAKALPDQDPSTIHQATATGAPCMQVAQGSLTAAQVSEDCLFMQIIRPHGISSSNPIPVVVFIHGGGWAHGASTFDVYNGTALVQGSVAQKQPIIFVNFNYRLGVFGFLGGKDMQSADAQGTANLNTGYWDQHDALRFIQENIGAFGGDPNRVTIWGQSAGAASVAAHVFANNGKAASGLFSKAIMESGSAQLYPRYSPTASTPQSQYQALLKMTSCTSLACLRKLPAATLNNANVQIVRNGSTTFSPTLDSYFHTMPPSQALAAGSFADVPILMGVNLDDGTFVPSCSLMDTNSDLQSFFQSQYGSASAVSSLLREYPDNVAQDCPFRPELYGVSPTDRFYGLTSQYKRCTAIETDLLFVAGMRSMLSAAAKRNTHAAYGYLWAQRTSNNGVAAKGVTHSCELGMVFNRPTLGGQSDAAAQRYASDSSITATTNHMVTSLLTFVNNGNPNSQNFPSWPAYGPKAQIMQFQGTYNTTVISDTYRSSQVNSLLSQVDSFGI